MALNIKAIRVKVTAKRAAAYMSALPYFNPLMQRPPTLPMMCKFKPQHLANENLFQFTRENCSHYRNANRKYVMEFRNQHLEPT